MKESWHLEHPEDPEWDDPPMKKKVAYKVEKRTRRLFEEKKYPVNNQRTRRHLYE